MPQGGQVVPVALTGVPVQLQSLEKAHITLMGHEVLGHFTPIKGMPQNLVDLMVELIDLRRVGNAVGGTHDGKGPGRGLGKIKQRIVCVKEQIGIFHETAPSFLFI